MGGCNETEAMMSFAPSVLRGESKAYFGDFRKWSQRFRWFASPSLFQRSQGGLVLYWVCGRGTRTPPAVQAITWGISFQFTIVISVRYHAMAPFSTTLLLMLMSANTGLELPRAEIEDEDDNDIIPLITLTEAPGEDQDLWTAATLH